MEQASHLRRINQLCEGLWECTDGISPELVDSGDFIFVSDFRLAAEQLGMRPADGTYAFRQLVLDQASVHDEQLSAELSRTMYTRYENAHNGHDRTTRILFETQLLYNVVKHLEEGGHVRGLGEKSKKLVYVVLYDMMPDAFNP